MSRHGSYRRMDFSWKEYFRDPSPWCHHQSSKKGKEGEREESFVQIFPELPHFPLRASCYQSSQNDEWHIPCWVHAEFQRRVPFKQGLEDDNGKDNIYENHLFSYFPSSQSYVREKYIHDGIKTYAKEKSSKNNLFPFVPLIQACAKEKDHDGGIKLHFNILEMGFSPQKDVHIVSSLINMYAKCGAFLKAQELLEKLSSQNVVCWNSLITGYAEHGKIGEVLNCYERMQSNGICPDAVTFIGIVKACISSGAIATGKQIHHHIVRRGLLQKNITLGNALIDMYAKFCIPAKANEILKELLIRNVVSWSALIAGYAQQGRGEEALDCFKRMKNEALIPNFVTFICILKACGIMGSIDRGKEIHEEIMSRGLIEKDVVLGNALVDMYAKCGMLAKSQRVLEELPVRNVVSWNALISGYAQQGECHGALSSFDCMQNEGLSPDAVTFTCILKACSSTGAVETGKHIHDEIVRRGLLEKDVVLGTALVDMYAACSVLGKAQQVLEHLPLRNASSWSALISGYTQQGQGHEALVCYEKMRNEGLSPDSVTFICILSACGNMRATDKGKQIHEEIVRKGLVEKDIVLGNALLDMYVKCGMLEIAKTVLEELPSRDLASWSILIFGYVRQDQGHEAFDCLERMLSEGLSPDAVAFICILKACGSIGAIGKGKQIHVEISKKCLAEENLMLGTALVDMYARAGMLGKAKVMLEELPIRDIVSWNALIAGYSQRGQAQEALNCFEQMQIEGLSPDEVTFVCVLSACSHSGLLQEAQMLFGNMGGKYNVRPSTEHHNCMVIFLACSGCFEEAMLVIEGMASARCSDLWLALLGACRKWANVKLGKLVFDQLLQLDDTCAAAYGLMGDIFAASGMREDAKRVETMRLNYSVAASSTWKMQLKLPSTEPA